LQNKALIQGNDVDLLARTLYNLVSTFFSILHLDLKVDQAH
jgi:hypothetical protein